MKKVKVSVERLLEILKVNKKRHSDAVNELMVAYREKVIEELDKALTAAREGKVIITDLNLVRPLNMTKYYDRAIGMLEMTVDTEIDIAQEEYSNYVLDKWHWSSSVLSSSSSYSTSSSTSSSTRSYLESLVEEEW